MMTSPILKLHQQAEALIAPWGGAEGAPEGSIEAGVPVVQGFGELELEYAAIRKACGLFDTPQRGVVEVTGSERLSFLNRMVTQELKGMKAREMRGTFWLNRKGRIDAELRLFETGSSILIDVDVHALKRTVEGLNAFVIADDVAIAEVTGAWTRMALHGPTAAMLLDGVTEAPEGFASVVSLAVGGVTKARFVFREATEEREADAADVWVMREDQTGEVGLELFVPRDAALAVYRMMVEAGSDPGLTIDGSKPTLGHRARLRPIGWHAFNIARIEAGTPVYNIDFGPQNLPAETGILEKRVSFTKGCYLGQEIVARMHARGHPKQMLVALKVKTGPEAHDKESGLSFIPVSGGPIYAMPPEGLAAFKVGATDPIGAVTSSTLAPMLSAAPICLAQVKWDLHHPGMTHVALAEGVPAEAVVQEKLAFWSRG